MRSLHGLAHFCVVVADSDRGGKPVHLIVVNGEPVWPLLNYFQSRNLNLSTEATYAHAAGLLIDFIAVKTDAFADISERSQLLNAFAHDLLYGTIRDDDDPSGLWWHARSSRRARRLMVLVCQMSDWLHDRYATTAINPVARKASVAEQIAFWRRWNMTKASSLLKHTKSRHKEAKVPIKVREIAFPGKVSTVSDAPPAFPEEHVERLLFEGFVLAGGHKKFVAWKRWNIRDILITLLLHYGGLRVSEPMHLWVDDIFIDSNNPGNARVLVHHPHDGIYEHADPISGQMKCSNRADYLRITYGRVPLTQMTGRRHAGWKNSLLTHRKRNAFEVFWFPLSMGELFLQLYRIYIQHVRPISLNHPYLFVTQDGQPMTTASFTKNHERAITRIGLLPSKDLGTSTHGHRHAYGQRAKKGELGVKEIQLAMHHVSPLSQDVYTQPNSTDVWSAIQQALPKLGAAGFPVEAPHSLLLRK